MKTLKTYLITLCLLPVLAIGMPQFDGVNFFMEKLIKSKTYGDKIVYFDECDLDLFESSIWYLHKGRKTFYARNSDGRYFHRICLDITDRSVIIDHIDENGLNNQRYNLRKSTNQQNLMNCGLNKNNTSGYKGITQQQFTKRWAARITNNYKGIHLGYFDTPEEAALAYNAKAIEFFGEFARLNVIS